MAMESPVKMVSSLGMVGVRNDNINKNPDNACHDDYAKELGLLLKDRTRVETIQKEKDREKHFHRSGSAPPSVEGSLAAIGGLFPQHSMEPTYFPEETDTTTSHPLEAEEQLRSDPAYLTYYYSNVNLNPRLPPPLISRENWKLAQWFGAVREKGNSRSMDDSGSRSLFSSQPVFASHKEELKTTLMDGLQPSVQGDLLRQRSTKWAQGGGDGLIGLSPSGLGARCKSFADLIQEEFPVRVSHSPAFHLSRPSSRAAHEDVEDPVSEFNARSASITTPVLGSSRSSTPNPLNQGNLSSNGFTTSSTTGRSASPAFGLGAQPTTTIERPLPRNASITASSSLAAALQNLSVSDIPESSVSPEKHFTRGEHQQEEIWRSQASYHGQLDSTQSSAYAQALLQLQLQQQLTLNPNMYSAAMSYVDGNISCNNNNLYYQNSHLGSSMYSPNYGLENYSLNSSLLPSMMMGGFPHGTLLDSSRAVPSGTSLSADMQHLYKMGSQASTFDTAYIQYLQQLSQDARLATSKGGYLGGSAFADIFSMQKSNNSLLPSGSPLVSPAVPSGTHSSPLRSPWLGSSWPGDPTDESRICSLLEEFKNSKTKCFELSDIVGKVAEFSVDQHGSRFIQQKLEVANPDEKALVFQEIFPRALTLMTDVFGNYVIQKFFEYGTPQQKTELANQLVGHVLSLSLQMYGCRVIQKAIEALDVDQQTWLVSELDGSVIRCVRDQNGNHVIQKCIECIPQDRIRFIISAFFGQVVTLSTHPYGCRVIQRVLEHCSDEETQKLIMDEILQSVCNLSHDQYGNYVVQHILEHGKPHERSDIVKKIAGQFVQMSQHKFASNVVEKCLEFGSQVERQILINEMLGDMEENEPLQAMMKDQFANYVVQKVLETCDERQRGILLARIKLHLHSLKKYTYGKHIVARVEKLVVAAERQNANHAAQKALI